MKIKSICLAMFFFSTILGLTLIASAAIPHLMNYQGKATDKAGMPLNGTYNLTFRIYNAATGGTPKWTEVQPNIAITNGIFQVQLGSVTPLTLPFDESYWISLEINSDGEMSPRTNLASVPYAYKAETLVENPAIPFYKKGFDIVYVDFNTIKLSAGVIDLAGKMFATTSYSSTLALEYLDSSANRDWVHGAKSPNINVYVYAYNNNGQIAFKLSDEGPNLSDQYGNISQQPFSYRRYPNTDAGQYYRYIGQMPLDNVGNFNSTRIIGSDILPIAHERRVFATPGIYTFEPPVGVTKVFVEVVGGGGGGSVFYGGWLSNGSIGGTSSFGSFCSATGGAGASGVVGGVDGGDWSILGGTAGVGQGGDINAYGQQGQAGYVSARDGNKNFVASGCGGSSHMSGGANPNSNGVYGGGGGGEIDNLLAIDYGGGGGGGGGFASKLCTLTGSVTVTVGTGGAGGSQNGHTAGSGGAGVVIVSY